MFPPAPFAKRASKRNQSRFFEFHDMHGHTTLQCRDLKNQAEDLVKNRYFDEFINGSFPIQISKTW